MKAQLLTREIAEQYLDEMIEAQGKLDYYAWCRRWRDEIYEEYSEEKFIKKNKHTIEELGQYQCREYIGCEIDNDSDEEHRFRFIWKASWENYQSVITVGIHEFEGIAYVDENWYHFTDENIHIMLLNAVLGESSYNEPTHSLDKTVAEQYLDEILDAKKYRDYDAWNKHWEGDQSAEYTNEDFIKNIEGTLDELGHYVSREYVGSVCGDGESGKNYLYAWKSQYEKQAAISTLGIYEKEGVVYLSDVWTSYGDDHIYMLLLNAPNGK